MIEGLKSKQSLKAAELQDGDIVCFQRVHERRSRLGLGENKSTEEANKASDRADDAREYYDFLLNKKLVKFHAHPTKCDPAKYPPFDMVLNSRMSYDRLSEKIGERLGVEPTHLRFYTVNGSTGNPRAAVKRGPNLTVNTILNAGGYGQLNVNQRADALYFEVLDMSLAELDTKKNIRLTYLSEGIVKEVRCLRRPQVSLSAHANKTLLRITLTSWSRRVATSKILFKLSSEKPRSQTRRKVGRCASMRRATTSSSESFLVATQSSASMTTLMLWPSAYRTKS